jgi:hypothetical protein
MTRLETLSPDLARKLEGASVAKQRAAALAACQFAISHAQVNHPLVKNALQRVRAASVLTPEEKAGLDGLAAQLDEEYLAMQEAADKGRVSTADYMRLFGQARAVAALSFAGGEDAFHAATEAIYEAAATSDDNERFSTLIQSVLK